MIADLGLVAAAAYPLPPNYSRLPLRKPSASSLYEPAAMASVSPSSQPSQPGFGGGGPSSSDGAAPSNVNLDVLKTLTEKRTTRDGQPQKRRGPKPDSKPALTRRQELNRQAQRTHRERKELYIKALEDEVLRLKEIFSNVSQDKERLAEENRQLKALLAQNGLGVGALIGGGGASVRDDSTSNPSVGYSPSMSMAGSYVPASSNTSALTPPPLSASSGGRGGGGISPHTATYPQGGQHQRQGNLSVVPGATAHKPNQNPNLDYEQAGIDFVLTLEKPCMNHLPWMLERNTETGGREACGHALMASCPPEPLSQLPLDHPFRPSAGQAAVAQQFNQAHGRHHHPTHHNHTPHKHGSGSGSGSGSGNGGEDTDMLSGAPGTWTLSKGDLATLLDLSRRLNLDGEITPVMAWGMVLAHPRLGELRPEDFERLAEELGGKVRCYGFGAVMEEFEVRDALENAFSMQPDFGSGY